MPFRGWPAEALEFFEGLAADNSRTYWLAHKPVYDEAVLAPMLALLAELEPEFGPGKVFRPNRDVRFSRDKSPYKTAIGATVGTAGYVQLSAAGLASGSGTYGFSPDQLARYRAAVLDDSSGTALVEVVEGIRRHGIELTGHDVLKSAPRGVPADHPRLDLLRHKGLITWRQWPAGSWLGTARAKARVLELLRASEPLRRWLAAHVGEAAPPTP